MPVSKRTRYEVLRRDNYTCRYCGGTTPDVTLTVDHVVPRTLGGSDFPDNLVAACRDCNAGKAASSPDSPLVAEVAADATAMAAALQQVIAERSATRHAEREELQKFDTAWSSWTSSAGEPFPKDHNWKSSVLNFLAAGLDQQFLADAIDIAIGNPKIRYDNVWRYFCGVCYRELDDIRERATTRMSTVRDPEEHTLLPAGAGVDPSFDLLNLTDSFLANVMDLLHVKYAVQPFVHRAYWAGMSEAYRGHMAGEMPEHQDPAEWLREQFESGAAADLAKVKLAVTR